MHAEMPIIGGISKFQLLRIHYGPLLQYTPTPWAHPARSEFDNYQQLDQIHARTHEGN